ncbi:MAG: VOC family protein [Chloroflexi bacterium]|nr:VOC family protein [Chloroflexota bacterium]
MIRGLAGVIIWTDDLPRMVEFYRDTLGLTPNSERPHFVSFKWGRVKLGIGKHSGVKGASGDPYRVMVNLDVEDIHAAHGRLSNAGATIIRPPEREHWGGWVCTFTDPDGNILQLLEQPNRG